MNPARTIETSLGEAVRRLRERQQLSLRTLAERSGFSASFLSQVENGQASPSISSMERIAAALGVTLGQFFQAAEATPTAVVRSDQRPVLNSEWSEAWIEALGVQGTGTRLEPMLVTLRPGGTSGKRPHPAATEEFALVIDGSVTLTLDGEAQTLGVGDAVTIRQGTARCWQNASADPAQFLVVALRSAL